MALTTNLVAHWLLASNTDDSYGSYDGTAYGGVMFDGDVANFAGTDDRITTLGVPLGHTYTFSFWNNFDTIGTYTTPLGSGNTDKRLTFTIYADGRIAFYVGNGSDWGTLVGSATGLVTTGTLYNIQIVVDNKSANIYINNGSSIASGTLTNDLGTQILNLGTRYAGGATEHFIDGAMSNVRVYSDAKDATFRTELYDEGESPKYTRADAVLELTATASPTIHNTPRADAILELLATGVGGLSLADTKLFSFVQSIQSAQAETKFSFVQSIEQPKTATIVKRITS